MRARVANLLWAGLGGAVLIVAATARDARACGGCFHGPSMSGTVITDHRMIFAVSPQQTTLYDEIEYTGAPSSFAWVLPIHGTVTVGLSSDVLFSALDQVTQTTIAAPPPPYCPPPPSCPCCNCFGGAGGAADASVAYNSAGPPPVTVLSQSVVGPYDTVQLQSTDPNALNTWLTANGYAIPAAVQPVIAAYVTEGFNFLAMRLAPGQGVQAMRPVSVTSTGAGLSLPLRMVAAGTGATVGITLWVVSTGRYEPANFSTFSIAGSDLVWDWSQGSQGSSNYATVRAQKEASFNNAAWQVESSLSISPYQVESLVLSRSAATDYVAPPASDAGGTTQTPAQVRMQDLATCFPGGTTAVRITRMRADLSHAALANDLVLQASADQSTMSNIYRVTQSVNAPACPTYAPITCPACPSPPVDDGGTIIGVGDDGGGGGSPGGGAGGGMMASPGASAAHESFGCAAAPGDSRGGLELALAGLVGVSIVRSRARRKK